MKLPLDEIEKFSELQFSVEEVSILVGLDPALFETDEAVGLAFMRGRLRAQAEVRESVLLMAKQGSTPAQKHFMSLSESSEPEAYENGSPPA